MHVWHHVKVRYHRITRHARVTLRTPHATSLVLVVRASLFLHSFQPSPTKPCREAEIVAGVAAAQIVEEVVVVVVVHLEVPEVAVVVVLYPENRAGMSSSLPFATLNHVLSASLQRANPLILTLALLTRPRTG
jgi:hypothetical protein